MFGNKGCGAVGPFSDGCCGWVVEEGRCQPKPLYTDFRGADVRALTARHPARGRLLFFFTFKTHEAMITV